jgi:hypothetical protein
LHGNAKYLWLTLLFSQGIVDHAMLKAKNEEIGIRDTVQAIKHLQ